MRIDRSPPDTCNDVRSTRDRESHFSRGKGYKQRGIPRGAYSLGQAAALCCVTIPTAAHLLGVTESEPVTEAMLAVLMRRARR